MMPDWMIIALVACGSLWMFGVTCAIAALMLSSRISRREEAMGHAKDHQDRS